MRVFLATLLVSFSIAAETIPAGTLVCTTSRDLEEVKVYKYITGEHLDNKRCARAPKEVEVKVVRPGLATRVIIETNGKINRYVVDIDDIIRE